VVGLVLGLHCRDALHIFTDEPFDEAPLRPRSFGAAVRQDGRGTAHGAAPTQFYAGGAFDRSLSEQNHIRFMLVNNTRPISGTANRGGCHSLAWHEPDSCPRKCCGGYALAIRHADADMDKNPPIS